MVKLFKNDPRVSFLIGDVHNQDRLYRALDGINCVVRAMVVKWMKKNHSTIGKI
jgi:UDP-N-acetylglucosamine 4,6-dehydratase/5-epimerase